MQMNLESGLFKAVGSTPAVPLDRLFPSGKYRVYAKLEQLNPSGSAKDRPALRMMLEALRQGEIGPGSVIIESSSGNLAISLAWICKSLGLPFICVVDPKTSEQNLRLLHIYGARIEAVTEPDKTTGEYLPARLARVKELVAQTPDAYWPNQYANENNCAAHRETMRELHEQLGCIDYLFAGVSTCGTIRGCSEYARAAGLPTKLIAVDAEGSVIFGGTKGYRRFPGLGSGIDMPFGRPELPDRIVRVSDERMVKGCRDLLRTEGIMAGPSTGGVIEAVRELEEELPEGAVIAVIVHDRGDRYIDTVYNDQWVLQQFGRLNEQA